MTEHDDSRDDKHVQRVKVVGIAHAPLLGPTEENAIDDKTPPPAWRQSEQEREISGESESGQSQTPGDRPISTDSKETPAPHPTTRHNGSQRDIVPGIETEPGKRQAPDSPAPSEDGTQNGPVSTITPDSRESDRDFTDAAAEQTQVLTAPEAPSEPEAPSKAVPEESSEQRLRHGLARHQAGDLAAAEAIYRQVIEKDAESADAQHLLGLVLHLTSRNEEAEPHLRRAITLRPQAAEFHNSFGAVMIALGRHDEAYAAFEAALAIRDDLADAHYNLGYLDHASGRLRQALTRYRKALDHNPTHVPAMINWGSVLMDQDRLKEADTLFQRALKTNPGSLPAIKSKARVLRSIGKLNTSVQLFQKAIELAPDDADSHFGLGESLLLSGDFKQGFEEYEWRLRLPMGANPGCPAPQWNGASLDRKSVLVHVGDHDGEAIQLMRYASFLAAKGARVSVECPAQMCRLLETVAGVGKAYKHGEAAPEFDCHVPLLSLPRLLNMASEKIPTGIPYLSAPDGVASPLPEAGDARMRVGLVWRRGTAEAHIDKTGFPPTRLLDLASMPGLAFISLQGGLTEEEAALLRERKIEDVGSGLGDQAELAAAINELDLLISTDATAAHIAGALGTPVWLLIRQSAHWAWLRDREDSPWYPSMRIFRQDTLGDWSNIARRLPVTLAIEAGKSGPAS